MATQAAVPVGAPVGGGMSAGATGVSTEAILGEAFSEMGLDADDAGAVDAAGDTTEAVEGDLESESTDDADVGDDADGEPEANPDVEEIEVKGAEGPTKVKIDYTDRAAIKRAHQKAAGVDHLYKRYKEIRTERDETAAKAAEYQKDKQLLGELEVAFGEGGQAGFEGLVDRLMRGSGGVSAAVPLLKGIVDKYEKLTKDPGYQRELDLQKERAEAAQWKKKVEAMEGQIAEQATQQKLHAAQAAVDSVYPQYSFKGKLGDPVNEQRLDEFMFTALQSRLAQAEGAGYPLTPDLVRTAIKEISATIPAAIHQEARRLATRSKDGTSTRAKKAAQAATVKGVAAAAKGSKGEVDWSKDGDVTDFMFSALKGK